MIVVIRMIIPVMRCGVITVLIKLDVMAERMRLSNARIVSLYRNSDFERRSD